MADAKLGSRTEQTKLCPDKKSLIEENIRRVHLAFVLETLSFKRPQARALECRQGNAVLTG